MIHDTSGHAGEVKKCEKKIVIIFLGIDFLLMRGLK
jgi:hypothetical protein